MDIPMDPNQPPLPPPMPLPMPLPPALPQLDPAVFTSDTADLATLPLPARLPQPPALPVPAIPNDTPPDVQPIAHYFATFSAKPYLAALVRKSNRQLPDGRPAPTQRDTPDWSLWYIEAVGPSILFWPCAVLPRPSTDLAAVGAEWIAHVKTSAMPNFLNITDADVRVASDTSRNHIVQLNTAGCNLILLQTASALDQAALVASVRLACFEFSKLHECYTAALLRRPALATLPVPAAPDFHGYVQVRYPGSTEWTRLWCVVTPEPGMSTSGSSNSVTNLLKRKSLALTSSNSNPNLQAAAAAAPGLVHFYPSKKSNLKKPALSLGNVFQAYAVYPERPHLIDLSMLCKLEGTLVIRDPHPSSPVSAPGFILVMTESPAAMAHLLVAIVTRFHLYNVHGTRKAGTIADSAPLQITPPRAERVEAGTLYLDPAAVLARVPVDADHVATKAWLEKTLAAESTSVTPPVTVLPEGAGVTPRQRTPPGVRVVGAGMRPESTIRPGSMVVTGRAPQLPSDTGSDSDDSDDESSGSNEDDDDESSDGEGSGSDRVLAQRGSMLVGAKPVSAPASGANGLAKDMARMSVTPATAKKQPRSSGSECGSEDEKSTDSSSSSESESDDEDNDKTPPSSSAPSAAKPTTSPVPKSVSPTTAAAKDKPLPAKPSDNSDSGTVSDTEDSESDASTTSGSGSGSGTDDSSDDSGSDSSSSGSDVSTSDSGSESDADDDNQILPPTARAGAGAAYPPQFDPSAMPGGPGPTTLDPYSIDFMAGLGGAPGTGSDNSSQSNLPFGASAASSSATPASFAPNSLLSNPNAAATNRVDTAEPLVPAFVQFGGLLSRPKPSLLAQHQEVQKRQQYYAQLQTFQQQQQMEAAVRQQEQYAVLSRPRGPLLQMASPRDRDREASGLLSVVSQREQTRAQQKHMYGGGGYSSSGVAELVERGAGTGKAVAMDFERDRERLLALEQRQMAKELAEERQRMEEMMQVKREQQRMAMQHQQAQAQQQMMWQQQQQQAQQRAAAMQQQQQQQQAAAAGLYGAPPGARGSYYGAPPPAGMMGMQPVAPPPQAGGLSSTDSSEEEDDDESGSESETGGEDESWSESSTSGSEESASESASDDEPPVPAARKGKGKSSAAAAAVLAAKAAASRAIVASDDDDDKSRSDSDDSEPSTPRHRTAGKRQPTAAKSSSKTPTAAAKSSKKQRQRALAAAPAMPPPMPSPYYGAPGGPPTAVPPPQPGMYGPPPPQLGATGALPSGVHPAHAAAYAMQMQHMQQQMYANMGMMSPMMAAMMMQQQQQMAAMHQQMAAMPPPPPPSGRKARKKAAVKGKKGKKARREPSSSEEEEESMSEEERSASEEDPVGEESESSEEEERRARRARRKAKGKSGKRK